MSLALVVACSDKIQAFDDDNIIFEVTDSRSSIETNTVEITNETGFDLENLTLKINYPLDTEDRSNSNNEREIVVEYMGNFKIKSSETKEFLIPDDLKEDFEPIDLEIDFEGNVVEGNKKVPFEMGGGLGALVRKH